MEAARVKASAIYRTQAKQINSIGCMNQVGPVIDRVGACNGSDKWSEPAMHSADQLSRLNWECRIEEASRQIHQT